MHQCFLDLEEFLYFNNLELPKKMIPSMESDDSVFMKETPVILLQDRLTKNISVMALPFHYCPICGEPI